MLTVNGKIEKLQELLETLQAFRNAEFVNTGKGLTFRIETSSEKAGENHHIPIDCLDSEEQLLLTANFQKAVNPILEKAIASIELKIKNVAKEIVEA